MSEAKPAKFRKKPVVVEAIRWTGRNTDEVLAFGNSGPNPKWGHDYRVDPTRLQVHILTLEGTMVASVGDWIIKGVNGEFYPCKPDIFDKTYEPAEY